MKLQDMAMASPQEEQLGAVLGLPFHSFTSAVSLSWASPGFLWLWPSSSQFISFLEPFHSYPRGRGDFLTEDACDCKDEWNFFRSLNTFALRLNQGVLLQRKSWSCLSPFFSSCRYQWSFQSMLSRAWRRGSWRDRGERIFLRVQKELIWLHVLMMIWVLSSIF